MKKLLVVSLALLFSASAFADNQDRHHRHHHKHHHQHHNEHSGDQHPQ